MLLGFACGSPSPTQQQQQAKSDLSSGPPRILILGTTHRPADSVSGDYASLLPNHLQALGLKARIIDRRPAFGAPFELMELLTALAGLLQEHQPDWVLMDVGQAEAWVSGSSEFDHSRLSLDEFQLLYGQLLQGIQASGSRAILLTPCPTGPSFERWRNDRIQDYVQKIGLAANQYNFPVVDVWSAFMAYPDHEGSSINELLRQGRFPNAAGQERIAQQVAATLEYTLMYEQ